MRGEECGSSRRDPFRLRGAFATRAISDAAVLGAHGNRDLSNAVARGAQRAPGHRGPVRRGWPRPMPVGILATEMTLSLPPRRAEVLDLLKGNAERLASLAVRSLFLFGSVARDQAGPDSDVDLLVEFSRPLTYRRYMDLEFFLEDLLGCRVDLVTRGGLRPRALPAIEREAIRVA